MREPLLIRAGDPRVMLGNPPTPPKVDCRVVAEETWQGIKAALLNTSNGQLPLLVPRPLSSLTEAEAREVYRLAFGQDASNAIVRHALVYLQIVDAEWYTLSVYTDGTICAERSYSTESLGFYAVAVVRYLDSLGIALG